MFLIRTLFTALVMALLTLSAPAGAEEAEWPGFAVVRNTTVHVGRNLEYEAFLKELAAADKAEDSATTRIIESGIIADGGLYTTISFHTDFTDLNDPGSYARMHGSSAWDNRLAGLSGVVAHTERKLYYRRPDLGRANPELNTENVEIWYTYHVEVRYGANAQFEEWMQKLVEATDKVDPGAFWYTYAPWLNTGNVYRITAALTLEQMNSPVMSPAQRIAAAFSQSEADRLARLNASAVVSVDMTMLRNRMDLSYLAP